MHARSYFGEFDAKPIIEWLNAKRLDDDPVSTLLETNRKMTVFGMNRGLPIKATEQEIRGYLGELVRLSKLAVAPLLISAKPDKWSVDWKLVGEMPPLLGLAIIRLLHLAERGLLGRVRKCAAKDCGKWFYAKFEHQRFDTKQCQQETFRRDPDWKQKRATYMRQLRHEKAMRERRWLRPRKRKEQR